MRKVISSLNPNIFDEGACILSWCWMPNLNRLGLLKRQRGHPPACERVYILTPTVCRSTGLMACVFLCKKRVGTASQEGFQLFLYLNCLPCRYEKPFILQSVLSRHNNRLGRRVFEIKLGNPTGRLERLKSIEEKGRGHFWFFVS